MLTEHIAVGEPILQLIQGIVGVVGVAHDQAVGGDPFGAAASGIVGVGGAVAFVVQQSTAPQIASDVAARDLLSDGEGTVHGRFL